MRVLRGSMIALAGASMVLGLLGPAVAGDTKNIKLSGLDEVPVVITDASGQLRVEIPKDENSISYTLTYEDIEGVTVTQAHIHLGQQHVATGGNVVVFLCTNLGNAPVSPTNPTPPCPPSPGEVSGTLDASNVVSIPAQGVGVGDLAAVITAIREGVAYGNVHTPISVPGAIRGQFRGKH